MMLYSTYIWSFIAKIYNMYKADEELYVFMVFVSILQKKLVFDATGRGTETLQVILFEQLPQLLENP